MLIVKSLLKTERFSSSVAARLKTCERINTFTESGWFFAYGWDGNELKVKTHADSREEYEAIMQPERTWELP